MSGSVALWRKVEFLTVAIGACLSLTCDSFAQFSADAATSQSYSNRAEAALLQRAEEISSALSKAGFIPAESFTNAVIGLEGQSIHPGGNVSLSACRYEFREGLVYAIRRKDLFEDKGPDSLILRHLTNEVLVLTKEEVTNRAFEILRCLSYDPRRIEATHRIRASDDLLTAYPIRNGGPNFPKDLHFFGELISRKKIKVTASMLPQIPASQKDTVFATEMRIDFLATTGELLEAWWLPDSRVCKVLEIPCPVPITISNTPDFAPPTFFTASRKLSGAPTNVTIEAATALTKEAWNELQGKLGNTMPKAILVCDNLNQCSAVAATLRDVSGQIPWAGVSHVFNMDLPFDASLMTRLAENKRGISLLAIGGEVQMHLEVVSDLEAESTEFGLESQEVMQRRFKELNEKYAPRVEPLINRMQLPETFSDHAVFLMQASANWASSVIRTELENRLRGKAQVHSLMGASEDWSIGQGLTYFNGNVYSNAIAVVQLSGNLPLLPDHHYALKLAAANLKKPPPGYDAAKIRARGPARIISGEVIHPFREHAFSFGPHPMQEVMHFFGERWIHFLQEADKVEVFRVAANRADMSQLLNPKPQPVDSGPKTPEGYKLLDTGKTLDSDSARELAQAILNDNNGPRVLSDCMFDPGVIFQIWRGKEYARLVVCFTCDESTLTFYDSEGNVLRRNLPFHFFAGRSTFVRLARNALPGDHEIETLH